MNIKTFQTVHVQCLIIIRHNEIRTAYVKFCIDSVIPVKRIKHYSNNKTYITKEVKECINQKHLTFKQQDPELLKLAQKNLNYKLRETRKNYRDLIDSDLSKSSKMLWSKGRCITNMTPERISMHAVSEQKNGK